MKIKSTNLAIHTTFKWRGKNVQTGIFKKPIKSGIFLASEDVENDLVIDRKYHGGIYKACYVFGANHYPRWQKMYPNLDWHDGMFGENITLDKLDESKIYLGDIYSIGEATVQITEPRQPCYKLNLKFEDSKTLKRFVDDICPGTYLRVIKPGQVKPGDLFKLITRHQEEISVLDMYQLQTNKSASLEMIDKIVSFEFTSEHRRKKLKARRLKLG